MPIYRLATVPALLACAVFPAALAAQTGRALITDRIDATKLATLRGNTRAEANAQNDRGAVAGAFAMEHMLLQLRRSGAQEQAAAQFIDQLHDPKSPNFHKWVTPAEFGRRFGAAQQDIDAVTAWLQSQGFVVNPVYPSGMTIDFSGTAEQVGKAFHTAIHRLDVNGRSHVANMSDPQIPAALAPAVAGVVSMHDFTPRPMRKARPNYTFGTNGSTYQAVTPGDLAMIYNFAPVFKQGYTGKGQTIAVLEDAVLYDPSDWDTFRATFGLSQHSAGSLTTVYPSGGGGNCRVPGLAAGDDGEAALDAEWATAAAPDAAIEVATCASTRATFGATIALLNLVNGARPPSVVSLSYGECEAANGAAANAAMAQIFQQAAAEGISVFVSSGDEGAASCDAGASGATHGIGVSGYASTPYNVAVGGTDFADSLNGATGTYWNAANGTDYSSAISYIPEIPWNDSCGNSLLAAFLGFASPYGTDGLCGSATARHNGLLAVAAGSGGPSGCASGIPVTSGVVGGTCQGVAKPSWQSGVAGIPADGVRDIPDVSLFAGTGVWGHYYVFCFTDVANGGAPCTGDPGKWAAAGGTSFGAPIMAGIQALIDQKAGGRQGNPNYVYYTLAAASTCDSSADTGSCIFRNITRGDIAVNCGGTRNCYGATVSTAGFGGRRAPAVDNGALSISTDQYTPAFGTAAGWNFATGLGSINVANLVNGWPAGR